MASGLGEVELKFATSITAPLFWVIRRNDGTKVPRNGSAFFLNTGQKSFGVTAAHVLEGWCEDKNREDVEVLQLGNDLPFDDLESRLIHFHRDIDIATFDISESEVSSIGKTILTGNNKTWPPPPPMERKGVYISGFPGVETIGSAQDEISFGAASGSGIAHSISDLDVSSLMEREHLIGVLGEGIPPENFNFSGMSGGPMITAVEHNGIRSWRLAGVIYEGPNPSGNGTQGIPGFELFKARRTDFILADGMLNVEHWDSLHP